MKKTINNFLPESWSLVFSAAGSAYGVGLLGLWALPFLISAIINDLKLNEAQAGILMSAEFVFTMLASLLVAPFMGRAPRRTLALLGTLLAIAANLVSANMTELYSLAAVRCVAGIGAGLALACGNACVSSAKQPDRIAGHMNVLSVLLMIVVMLGYAKVMAAYGLPGLYYAMAATMAVMLLAIPAMPQRAPVMAAQVNLHASKGSGNILLSLPAICMMLAMFVFQARDTMGWAFVERIGTMVGYSGDEVGVLLSFQSFVGLIGPLLAAMVGKRFGLSTPVILAILLTGATSLSYVLGEHSKTLYTIGVMTICVTYFYALSYLTGLAAALDREGRVVAAASSFLSLGLAVGPAISGGLISLGGFSLAAWGIAVTVLLTLMLVMIPLASIRREEAGLKLAAAI
ncbi:MFS transporter [Pseudomonas sp. P66]|jgi:predicted MFS family arabinose efflux permease|uniref:MFS transporter n=1 Tax=Pseudomonas arcuscaelestis TaxID=2710591 RepID=A0ABS2C0R0_9PSED|nr:MFS transporter [Pseudomonas arcuscaelestis]MBM3107490.1 MFS transporter [Pseudomonas arcuscaelestis]MBM3112523.1 MFS transporter [Pseudomonas arcuscaelestis]MBM5459467.1 MFS transporter [Pseudomonas arcuscaelestis]